MVRNYIYKYLVLVLLAPWLLVNSVIAANSVGGSADTTLLKDINIKIISDKEIKIFLKFAEKKNNNITAPLVVKQDNLLKLDFNNAGIKLDNKTIVVNHELVKSISTTELNNKLNLTVDIKPGAFYNIKKKDNIFALSILAEDSSKNKVQDNPKTINNSDEIKKLTANKVLLPSVTTGPKSVNKITNPLVPDTIKNKGTIFDSVTKSVNNKANDVIKNDNLVLQEIDKVIKPKDAVLQSNQSKVDVLPEINKPVTPLIKEQQKEAQIAFPEDELLNAPNKELNNIKPNQPLVMPQEKQLARPMSTNYSAKMSAKAAVVDNIDFGLTNDNIAKITVTFSNDKIVNTVDDTKNYKKILQFVFKDLVLPSRLDKTFDVSDFGSIVQTMSWAKDINSKTLSLNILSKSPVDYVAYQINNQLIIEIKDKLIAKEESLIKNKEYVGKKISLNFQNIEIRSVLQLLADFTDLNLVASDSIHGSLSLRLMNVPWDQALEIVLKTKNLDKRKYGNILMIAPSNEIFELEKTELESERLVEKLIGLKTEYFHVNYAKSEDIAKLINSGTKGSILSERGRANFDNRTNMLIVQDTPKKLKEISEVLKTLDTPVRQVLIEARVVRASTSFQKQLGVRWGLSAKRTSNNYRIGIGDTASNATKVLTPGGVVVPKSTADAKATPGDTGFNIDLGLSDPSSVIGLALAKLPGKTLVHLELAALEAEGIVETISSPKIITANKVAAKIEQGQEIPYQQASSSGATNVAFKKVVLSLTVTPQITPDNKIIMDIKVTNDAANFSNRLSDNIPIIDTQQVETQVLIDNTQTIVLGGIFTQNLSNSIEKVPFLGNLPLIGRLFRSDQVDDDRAEFLIFITPKIVTENT